MAPLDDAFTATGAVGEAVTNHFNPHHRAHDAPAAAFVSFEAKPTQGLTPQELTEFAKKWQLSKGCVKLLRSLAPDVQKSVTAGFSPPEDTQDVSARCCAFARKKALRLAPRPVGAACSPPPAAAQKVRLVPPGLQPIAVDGAVAADDADLVDDFVSRWSLDPSSTALLRGLPEDVRATLMADFAPSPETRNVTGKLHAYVRRLRRGDQETGAWPPQETGAEPPQVAEDPAAAAFARHWALDGSSREVLRNLPADVRTVVLANFCPAIGSSGVSKQFCGFVNLQVNGRSRKGGRLAFEAPAPPVGDEAGPIGAAAVRATKTPAPGPASTSQDSRWARSRALANEGGKSWKPRLAEHTS